MSSKKSGANPSPCQPPPFEGEGECNFAGTTDATRRQATIRTGTDFAAGVLLYNA